MLPFIIIFIEKNSMECGVCLETYDSAQKQPVVLDCGHTICKECITDILDMGSTCPFDRKQIAKGLADLSINYSLMEMIEKFNEVLKISQKEQPAESVSNEEVKISYKPVLCSPPVICRNAHALKYEPETSHKYTQQYGFNQLMCDFCSKTWSGASWHCAVCNFDICTGCYAEEVATRTVGFNIRHRCKNGHQIYNYQNLSTYKINRSNNSALGVIRCEICDKEWTGAAFACKLCDYELCESCLVDLSAMKCDRKHTLRLANDVTKYYLSLGFPGWSCDICKENYTSASWHCRQCRFDVCPPCHSYYSRNPPINAAGALCFKGHSLIKSKDNKTYYRERFDSISYQCNGCREVYDDESNQCRRCQFDLCDRCVYIIDRCMTKGIRQKCTNNHPLTWHYDATEFYKMEVRCDFCRKVYSNIGTFQCRACKFDMCLNCASRNINP
jgi:hypothetical protein